MIEKRWLIKEEGNLEKVKKLSSLINVNEKIANLLVQRGVETYEEAKTFFRPSLSDLYDPFLMKDMDKAVKRLVRAVSNQENILIYGDYDVDGTSSVALIYKYLQLFNAKTYYYIPDRYNEGYGVSFKGIDFAKEKDCKLIISVDCGIKAVEQVKYANKNEIDFIICDHHNSGEVLPEALAILDPKRKDCEYPFKELSGAGVAFKLMQAYCQTTNSDLEELYKLLDLVVVSISSDIVPIVGENRVLAYYGLKQINSNPSIGLKSIINITGLHEKEIQINDIVFKIGPRINAAGRIQSGLKAVELLITENSKIAEKIGLEINSINSTRKELDTQVTQEALQIINSDKKLINAYSTVLYSENWHKGVIGIVASRLIESYYRPTIIFTKSNGRLTGSGRSVVGYNLYKAIESCEDLLDNFGGHKYAAGLTMPIENFEKFKQRFEEYVQKTITQEQRTPTINVDMEIDINDITPKFYRIIKQFAPFGPENMTPVFMSKKVYDNGSVKVVGKTKEHLKLKVIQKLGDNNGIDAIGFNFARFSKHIKQSKPFDLCFQLNENHFMNQKTIQIFVKDIHSADK